MNDYLEDLEARSEAAKALGIEIVPLLEAAGPAVAALALTDLLAAWLLEASRGDPDRFAELLAFLTGHIEKVVRSALASGAARPH